MAEPEADSVEPDQSDGAQSDTECGTTNFPHRRHYAVRRKLGRAKTARLAAKSDESDGANEAPQPDTIIKSIASPPCPAGRLEGPERPEEEDESEDDSVVLDETSLDDSDSVDDDEDDIFDQDEDGHLICAFVPRPLVQIEQIENENYRPARPVVPVITIQPGCSDDQVAEVETFYHDGPNTLLTTGSSLLYPVDERDAITSTAFLSHACR